MQKLINRIQATIYCGFTEYTLVNKIIRALNIIRVKKFMPNAGL